MRNALILVGLLSTGSALYACSSDPAPATPTDGGTEAATPDGGKADAKADGGNGPGTSCANPIAADLGTQIDGAFTAEGQSVYYSVKVTPGDFMVISADTEATADTESTVVDTAISVFDAAGTKLLAADDDAFPRVSTAASLDYKIPAGTTSLCVQVTDFDTWSGGTPKLAADPSFKFFAGKIDTAAEVVTFDAEPNDTTAAAQAGKLKAFTTPPGAYNYIFGTLKDAADVDVFKFTVPTGATSVSVEVPPIGAPLQSGKSSYGSTMARFTATIKKADGTIVSELAPPTGQVEKMSGSLSSPVEPGDYFLAISRPAGIAPGANDFYSSFISFGTSNPAETETTSGGNDTIATAQALTMTTSKTDPKVKDGYILAHLPAGDTLDNFSFPVGNGDKVSVACSAARDGSGLQAFKVELFVDGASKQSETETATADVAWSSGTGASKPAVAITAAGSAVLQLSAGSLSNTNTGTYYLCGVHVTSP